MKAIEKIRQLALKAPNGGGWFKTDIGDLVCEAKSIGLTVRRMDTAVEYWAIWFEGQA